MGDIKELKIVNVLRRFAFEEWGGTETVVWNTALTMKQMGHEPEIVCTRALSEGKDECVRDIPIHRFSYFYPSFPLTRRNQLALDKKGGNPISFPLYNYLRKTPADIVHCHTMARLGETVRLACGKRKIPYVVSLHGGYFDVPEPEKQEMQKPLRNCLNYGRLFDLAIGKNRFMDDAAGIICVGYNEYELARNKYSDKPVIYLPNGVDPDRFSVENTVSFRDKWQISHKAKMLLCVSRIDYQKNQKMLLSLTERLLGDGENVHLVLIGPVSAPDYFAAMQEEITKKNLIRAVTIIPGLAADSPQLIAAYQAADMFILPSLHEPFGIVVLEAWAAGVPVIGAAVGGLKKLIDHGRTGLLFDSENEDELRYAFRELCGNRQLRDALVANAAIEVRKNYCWSSVTEKLLHFYRLILDRRNS